MWMKNLKVFEINGEFWLKIRLIDFIHSLNLFLILNLIFQDYFTKLWHQEVCKMKREPNHSYHLFRYAISTKKDFIMHLIWLVNLSDLENLNSTWDF